MSTARFARMSLLESYGSVVLVARKEPLFYARYLTISCIQLYFPVYVWFNLYCQIPLVTYALTASLQDPSSWEDVLQSRRLGGSCKTSGCGGDVVVLYE